MTTAAELRERGEIGGRTAQIIESGLVECHRYAPSPLGEGQVRIRTVRSAISPGTEMTFYGRDASNVYLHRRWNDDLRLFEAGPPSLAYPVTFGYRAAGLVVESTVASVEPGLRVFGNWRHTELVSLPAEQALRQALPPEISWDDAVDIGQMGPICVNALAFADGEHRPGPVVVFGAGPVGLLTAQIARADGADRVYVIDRVATRLAIAESLGLDPILADGGDVAAQIKRRHGANGIAVALECSGSSAALHEAIRVVRRQGLVVAVGFYQGDASGLRLGEEFHHNGVRVVCGQIGNLHPGATWEALRQTTIDLCRSGRIKFGELPRSTLPIEDVAAGMASLRHPETVLQVSLSYDR
jgi:NADPH:quinone reductase-like Zn-dependent oxidoreductase